MKGMFSVTWFGNLLHCYEASLKLISSCLQWVLLKENCCNLHDYLLS